MDDIPSEPQRGYEFIEMLAEMEHHRVYIARDDKEKRRWAVKEIYFSDPEPAAQREFAEGFARDCAPFMKISHPCLPRVAEWFVQGGHGFLVKEHVEGRTLADIVRTSGLMQVDQVVDWLGHLAEAIKVMHSTRPALIVGGLKPNNIMIPSVGRPRIIDLGSARFFRGEARRRMLSQLTPWYTSPEQAAGEEPGPLSDVYSLGALAYFLLTARDPIPAGSGVPSLVGLSKRVPERLGEMIDRSLRLDPAERQGSMEVFAADLRLVGEAIRGRPFEVLEPQVTYADIRKGDRIMGEITVRFEPSSLVRVDSSASWLIPARREMTGRSSTLAYRIETAELDPEVPHQARLLLVSGEHRHEVPFTVTLQKDLVSRLMRFIKPQG